MAHPVGTISAPIQNQDSDNIVPHRWNYLWFYAYYVPIAVLIPVHIRLDNSVIYDAINLERCARFFFLVMVLCLLCFCCSINSSTHLSLLKPRRGRGQGDGPRRPENIGRRIAIRRSEIDRDVNFAKKTPSFIKMNTESINLMETPSDFVEPYFKKKPELLVIVSYSVNFIKNPGLCKNWFWSPSILWETPWTFQ